MFEYQVVAASNVTKPCFVMFLYKAMFEKQRHMLWKKSGLLTCMEQTLKMEESLSFIITQIKSCKMMFQ